MKHIINTLQVKNAISIKTLMKEFDVSEMTVRRDLTLLADDGIVELIPGGAILKTDAERDGERYVITHEETRRTREKIKIGKKAASIEPNDTIILDVGSTTEYIAKFIPEEIPVTILCYALNILVELYRKKNCHPIFAGGYFHDNILMFESPEGINLIKRIRANKAFISATGIIDQLGVTCATPYELGPKQAVMKSAKTKILMVDSTKFPPVQMKFGQNQMDF